MEPVHLSRIRLVLLAALAVAAFTLPLAAQAASIPDRDEAVTVNQFLTGRARPSSASRGVVSIWTNTGYSNRNAVYPVLEHMTAPNGADWVKVRVMRRPRNAEVWIPGSATRQVWIDSRIVIRLSSRTASVYQGGNLARRMRVVVGAPGTPTPTGEFYVVDRMRLHNSWARGTWALATSAYSLTLKHFDGGDGVVAMHGRGALTAPVGTAASHGCVRFNDGDIDWMAANIPNGTRIQIQR
jgi:lipoprotein-anchoring transpeptidase ErfK/SrfK